MNSEFKADLFAEGRNFRIVNGSKKKKKYTKIHKIIKPE